MIHISIPSTHTQTEPDDPFNKYTVYDIHVNGTFHASVRYNLLYILHEKLVETFGHRLEAPEFPPKKIWKLDNKALNERREALSKYLQGVIASPDVAKHAILENSFLEFQVKSFSSLISRIVKLEILLPDGRPVYFECFYDDSTYSVMLKLSRIIVMNEKNINYFGLFLAHQRPQIYEDINESSSNSEENGGNSSSTRFNFLCVRWLKNFESPFISQQLANNNSNEHKYKILIRRVIWDPSIEEPLLDDPGCLKILYLQALNDIQKGLLQVPLDVKSKLTSLQEFGEFKQFVRLCHLQVGYGYEWLSPVRAELVTKGEVLLCELKVGRRQVLLEYKDLEDNETLHTFKLLSKRIRVWRVSHLDNQEQQELNKMTFQLEYLIRKDEFSLFTFEMESTSAVLLSLFIQSIADEILRSREGSNSPSYKFDDCISIRAVELLEASKANSILSADQLSIKSAISGGSSTNISNGGLNEGVGGEMIQNGYKNFVIKLISYQMPFMENESFDDIGDEDL